MEGVLRNEKISLQLFPPNQSRTLDGSSDMRLLKGEYPTSRPWACTQPMIYQIEIEKKEEHGRCALEHESGCKLLDISQLSGGS